MNLSRPGPRGRYHSGVDLNEAFSSAMTLYTNLGSLVARDPDQEVQGPAIATVDAVLTACKELLPDHPVLSAHAPRHARPPGVSLPVATSVATSSA
jgi:hypothetical protein